jgi:hypothetical protein
VTIQVPAVRISILLSAVPLAWLVGTLVWHSTFLMLAVLMVSGGSAILTLGRNVIGLFHVGLGFALIGYAFLDKGFAYFGVAPLYIGEVVLGLGLASILAARWSARIDKLHLLIFAYMAWGLLRTIPFLGLYQFDALRDAVVWIYAVFALALSGFLVRQHVQTVVMWYRRLVIPFLLWVPIAFVLSSQLGYLLPRWPGTDVPIMFYKGGDMAVHLAGLAAFVLLGLMVESAGKWKSVLVWAIWTVGLALCFTGRSAMLTMLISLAVTISLSWFLPRPALAPFTAAIRFATSRSSGQVATFVTVISIALLAYTVASPDIEIRGKSVSVAYAVTSIQSVWSDEDSGPPDPSTNYAALQGSKKWRSDWWDTIVDYTFHGPYFWSGKGFGINLATVDGFQVGFGETLRSPHSIHFTILARTGVPGLLLWIALNLTFALRMIQGFIHARKRGSPLWAQIDGWILVYWLAFLINASFDVYIEGPQGGIWFWSVIGFGLAALRIQAEEIGRPGRADDDFGTVHAYPARP